MAGFGRPCHIPGLRPPGHEDGIRHRHQTHREEQQGAGQGQPEIGGGVAGRVRGVRRGGIFGLTVAPRGTDPSRWLVRRDTCHRRRWSPPGLGSCSGRWSPGRGRRDGDGRRGAGGGAGPGRGCRARRGSRRGGRRGGRRDRGVSARRRRDRRLGNRRLGNRRLGNRGRRNRGRRCRRRSPTPRWSRLPRGRRRRPVRIGRAGRPGGGAFARGGDFGRDRRRGGGNRDRRAGHRNRGLGADGRESGRRGRGCRSRPGPGQHGGNDPRLLLGQLASPGRGSRDRRLGSGLAGRWREDTPTAGAASYPTSRYRATPRANHPYIRYRLATWARYRDSFRACPLGSRRADTGAERRPPQVPPHHGKKARGEPDRHAHSPGRRHGRFHGVRLRLL
jgi:hypothetical protein